MPDVVRALDIAAPPSAVWRWFTTQEAMRAWFRPDLEIDLRVGGAFRMLGADGETSISGTVLELVPEGRLVLSWLEEDAGWTHPARLIVSLEPIATGTRVTLVHDGFAGIGTEGWRGTMAAYERGADRHRVLEQLAAVVASGG
ncbi:hypothetical protein ARHIZOSPH14_33730 [Agromyces rhizosphaerae]|uniref:Activator of Hsp90 ATPase homologue 1/2-like C-terminal domain-containing protein n=1 Tax=Agromyces rhizosphaerae TaxID=88374 RepID=A0A9W6FR18_9MICO|nr:SRPBCC family protein [Agromyces rhizosphaerae]GLI29131.1 hypothetical protein ARHIZOSPH14_33730 [Agromyces rhizosphaerae]